MTCTNETVDDKIDFTKMSTQSNIYQHRKLYENNTCSENFNDSRPDYSFIVN